MIRNKTEFTILPAFHGDCILIKTFDKQNNEFIILVDGGTANTFKYSLKKELSNIAQIDLLILTHIDSDHIAGLIRLFKSSLIDEIKINEIWVNHPDLIEINTSELISVRQGETFKKLINEKQPEAKLREISTLDKTIDKSGIEFIILSPTFEIKETLYEQWRKEKLLKEETDKVKISFKQNTYHQSLEELSKEPFSADKNINNDIFNSSSIAFILKCIDMSILLLADSRPEIVSESLKQNDFNESNPLKVDFVKISHHGSPNNTSHELLNLINSNNFIISTNGGNSKYKHPSRETISRIIYNSQRTEEKINIYFNYKIEEIKEKIGDFITEDDYKKGNWLAAYKSKFKIDDN